VPYPEPHSALSHFARAGAIRSRPLANLVLGLIRPSKGDKRLYVGLDISLRMMSICVVEADGSSVWEGKAESEPVLWVKVLSPWACRQLARVKTRDGTVGHPTDREKPDRLSGVRTSQLIRPRSAESIKASGYVRPRRKAGHMIANDHCSSRKILASRGPSTHEAALHVFA
jgi:hypothetical protein